MAGPGCPCPSERPSGCGSARMPPGCWWSRGRSRRCAASRTWGRVLDFTRVRHPPPTLRLGAFLTTVGRRSRWGVAVLRRLAACALLVCAACATTRQGVPLPPPAPEPTVQGDPAASVETRWRVVASARRLLGQATVRWPGQTFPDDCSGLVLGVYASVGVPLTGSARPGDNGVTAVWRWTSARGRLFRTGRPDPGDLVFFHDTYDRDHDGKL